MALSNTKICNPSSIDGEEVAEEEEDGEEDNGEGERDCDGEDDDDDDGGMTMSDDEI